VCIPLPTAIVLNTLPIDSKHIYLLCYELVNDGYVKQRLLLVKFGCDFFSSSFINLVMLFILCE